MMLQPTKTDADAQDIAIIGVACAFPGSDGPDAFFRAIVAGEEKICQPQPEWDAARYLAGTGPTRITTSAGGYLGDLFKFDPVELGVMPSSVDGGEPDQFLALKTARAALADAGYLGEGHDHSNSGIILGHSAVMHRGTATVVQHGIVVDQTVALLRDLFAEAGDEALARLKAALVAKLPPFNAENAPGLIANVMTGRIANKLDLRGPNYIIDAACASSLLAVNIAMEELRSGRSDLMLAGGVNASIPAEVTMVFTQLGAVSKSAKVRPFDVCADGTLLGEGLGIVVLKRLADALADGDKIYAVVKAVGQSSDGRGSGILAPRLEGEVLAMRRAYDEANIPQTSIGLVEAHGTGIALGDRTEIAALREVFGARLESLPRAALGSVKSMIGHCIPAAGIAGLIKVAMALRHKTLPPTLCDTVNSELGVETTRFYVNTSARPWIQPMGTPRRAAVNAFGFGGINSHAILQEAPATSPAPRPRHLPAELIVLAEETPAALVDNADRLLAAIEGPLAGASLASIGLALAERAVGAGPARIAIVAADKAELIDKLKKARARVASGRASLYGRGGYFTALAPMEGKVAFVFPGEGAQYQGMLGEVLTAFPQAREWFDFWDGLFGDTRGFRSSDTIFPPPTTLDDATASKLEKALFSLELGSESVFMASQALLAVTRSVGLAPDAVVGNSSGEHSALRAAGVFGGEGWVELEQKIRELNRLYTGMAEATTVQGGALLTVGAVPRDRMLALADGGDVHLALDNCYQQSVLYGDRPKLEAIATQLGREGGLCTFLPFDRPYHTPLFAPVAEMVEGTYRDIGFRAPTCTIYSCATAAPMPSEPDAIRALAAEQWRSRVRFTETIERMHADGFRIFVEVGPSANLTGFVDNILQGAAGRGETTMAVALDSRRRSSLGHMLSAFGRLWAAGRGIDVGALYSHRGIVAADLDATHAPASRERVYPNTLPTMRLGADEAVALRAALLPDGAPSPALADAMTALLPAATYDEAPRLVLPFLQNIVLSEPGRLVATCEVDAERDVFVRHHVLYATKVSDLNPELTSLPVVPLAVSMEMMAEIAAGLDGGGQAPVRLEKVRAHNWVALDAGSRLLTLSATVLAAASGERRYAAVVGDENGSPLVDAEVVFADTLPIVDDVAPLTEQRPSIWRDDELYVHGMFHGPLFQSIAGLGGWDDSGLDAWLDNTPLDGFFNDMDRPNFLLNPALLDAIGHVTAFWLALNIGTDFSSFPSRIERIDLLEAGREDTAGGRISGRLAFESGEAGMRYLSGDFIACGADGLPLFRATGWRDRFFDVSHRFYVARWLPREGWYGDDVGGLFPDGALPERTVLRLVPAFPPGFLDDAGGIWRRVIAHTVLSAEERIEWAALPPNPRRRDDWLIGRVAIKEAVRDYLARETGTLLMPADVVVRTDESGRPYVANDGLEDFGAMPEVSVAHVAGEAFAAAAAPGVAIGVDLELSDRAKPADLLTGGFSDAERTMLISSGASVLHAWCAKEAAAKCLGTGFNNAPLGFTVTAMDAQGATVNGPDQPGIRVALAERAVAVLAVAFV